MAEPNKQQIGDGSDSYGAAAQNAAKVNGVFSSIGLVKISFPVEEIYVAELKGE